MNDPLDWLFYHLAALEDTPGGCALAVAVLAAGVALIVLAGRAF